VAARENDATLPGVEIADELQRHVGREQHLIGRMWLAADTSFPSHLLHEAQVLRWCVEWLERLERGESVVVNLRPAGVAAPRPQGARRKPRRGVTA
jgi:hypothetical protein